MNITEIKIRKLFDEGNVLALVSISIDGEFAVHDIKVIRGAERIFVAMPSRRGTDGVFRDIAHPISAAARNEIETRILDEYNRYLAEQQVAKPDDAEADAVSAEAEVTEE